MNIKKHLIIATFLNLLLILVIDARSIIKTPSSNNFIKLQVAVVDSANKSQLINKVKEKGSIRIWVYYNTELPRTENLNKAKLDKQKQKVNDLHNGFLADIETKELKINSINKMTLDPMIAISVDEEALKYIFKLPYVKKITEVGSGKAFLGESTSIVKADKAWGLGFKGDGEVIVILDTGVDYNHTMLYQNVIGGACFSTNDFFNGISSLCPNGSNRDVGISAGDNCNSINGCDHGTHVAGIAAGNTQNLKGVANGSDIISIQVFSEIDDQNVCTSTEGTPCLRYFDDDLKSALDYVYDVLYQQDNYNLTAVNMSLGSGQYSIECTNHSLAQSIDRLVGAGISVVAASGNEGYSNAMAAPACIPNVISVGATDNQDKHWEDSNAASFLDLVAPGVDITSSVPGNYYGQFTGTSQAAPHVAGTIAIMRSATPTLSVPQIRSILRNSAYWVSSMNTIWPYDQPSNEYGYGRLDVYQSLFGALYLNPNVILPDDYIVFVDKTYEGKDIYVQDNFTLYLQGEITLDKNSIFNDRPSTLNVLGTLEGSSSTSLNLIDKSKLNILPGGTNNYSGEMNFIIRDELTFTENKVFEDGKNLAIESGGKLNIVNGVTISTELGAKFSMGANTQIISVASAPIQNTQIPEDSYYTSIDPNMNKSNKKINPSYGAKNFPSEFSLMANYPNPFNPVTVIRYEVPVTSRVELAVFDLLGRKITTLVDGEVSAGRKEIHFDASNLTSGIYIYRIRANDFVETRQMTLIK